MRWFVLIKALLMKIADDYGVANDVTIEIYAVLNQKVNYMPDKGEFIGPAFHYTNKTCLKRV